jgi:hypothetical protein
MKLQSMKVSIWIPGVINFLLSIFLMAEAYLSLQWQIIHDGPILFYMGWLIRKFGFIPYRDFFDMNMPGAHWISALLGTVFGFSNPGYRRADLFILAVTLALVFLWLRSFGILPAWSGAVIFGLAYLQYGPGMSLQREFLILPFLLAALILFPLQGFSKKMWQLFASGIFLGLAVLIKPQSGLMLFIFMAAIVFSKQEKSQRLLSATLFTLGCGLPFLVSLVYLGLNQALPAFIETSTRYWPLYTAINGRLEINTGVNPLLEILDGLKSIGSPGLWLIPAGLGFFSVVMNRTHLQENRLKAAFMAGGAFSSLLGVIIANKYWEYHWLPFIFFMILLSSTGLSSFVNSTKSSINWAPAVSLILVMIVLLRPSVEFWLQINGQPLPAPEGGRVDEISKYLVNNLQPGDTVQPLDWSNGAVHAMLAAKAVPATRYLYDFHFYHHISEPEIQFLRQDLISQLTRSKPKLIIQFVEDRPWVNGPDTTREFSELQQFIKNNYFPDKERNGYIIWQRK